MTDWPTCSGMLKNGDACRSKVVRVEGVPGEFCAHHLKQASAAAPSSPAVAEDALAAPDGASHLGDVGAVDAGEPVESERIGSLRAALRDGLLTEEVAALIQEQLVQGLAASRDYYVSCPTCGKRHPVALPDLSTRMNAARALLEELEGKVAQQQAPESAAEGRRLEDMTDEELLALIEADEAAL